MMKVCLIALLLSVSLSKKMSTDLSVQICTDRTNGWTRYQQFFDLEGSWTSVQQEEESQDYFWANCQYFLQSQSSINKQFQNSVNARFHLNFEEVRNNKMRFTPGIGKTENDVQQQESQDGPLLSAAKKLVGSSCPPNHQSLASPPKDQGTCGSCWTFSTAAVYESAWNRINNQVLDLSEEYILECTSVYDPSATPVSSCQGGILDHTLEMLVNTGLPSESAVPYVASTYGSNAGFPSTVGSCSSNSGFTQVVFPSNNSNALWFRYDNLSSSAIQTLLERGSLVVAYYVDPTFYSYSSGIFSCPVNSTEAYANINHAVELVGMDCSGNYIIKNSWGTSWGNGGFATIDAANDCGLSAFVYSVLGEEHLKMTILAFLGLLMALLLS